MKGIFKLIFPLILISSCTQAAQEEKLVIWYDRPAENWNEALPIGNGHSGAMVFGGVEEEHLQLNENTLYSGEPSVAFKDVKITTEMFDKVVSLMKAGKYPEATDLVCKNWLGRLHQSYEPFGDLYIHSGTAGDSSDYRRSLNISDAVLSAEYSLDGSRFHREVFASYPDNVIVIRLWSDSPDGIIADLDFKSPHPGSVQKAQDGKLILHGQAPGYVERRPFEQMEKWGDQYKHPELYDADGHRKFNKHVLYGDEIDGKGMFFEAQLKPVLTDGGECEISDAGIHIQNVKDVYFMLSLATSYNGFDKSPSKEGVDPSAKAASIIEKASAYDYKTLKRHHLDDYHSLFDRVSLNLPSTEAQKALPTDQRIQNFASESDPALAALLFQFGRYLMISGSRPGGQPLNLQGMWNKDTIPAWNSAYTININTEMNYWPAEVTNLSECTEPLFEMIRELSISGSETARNMYGRRGWVVHHNTSIWRETVPNDNVPTASFWPMAQGWFCSHLWEHYLFTQDEDFLRDEAYPLMKGAAEFYSDWLIDDGNGHLVTPVGVSPENRFIMDDGRTASLSMGPTMDMSIIRELFSRTVSASEILGVDEDFRKELNSKLERLLPFQIGSKGQLQEWMYDFKEYEPHHRHLSHLYGFYPGDQITLDRTPELFDAVRKTLELRGDMATGWSMGWKINCWARQLDGNHAYKIIENFFNPVGFGKKHHEGGGIFMNMLCAHPPFQIDGNLGYVAGVAEMLLQSHAGFIELLPALPDAWGSGEVSGLRARNGFEVGISWKDCQLEKASVKSLSGKTCSLRAGQPFTVKCNGRTVATSKEIDVHGRKYNQAEFETKAGEEYSIVNVEQG